MMKKWILLACAILSEVTGSLSLKAALGHPGWYALVVAGFFCAFMFLALVLVLVVRPLSALLALRVGHAKAKEVSGLDSRERLVTAARVAVADYDWPVVAEQILRVYETVTVGDVRVRVAG